MSDERYAAVSHARAEGLPWRVIAERFGYRSARVAMKSWIAMRRVREDRTQVSTLRGASVEAITWARRASHPKDAILYMDGTGPVPYIDDRLVVSADYRRAFLPYGAAMFGAVLTSHRPTSLDEIVRVLRPGGSLVLEVDDCPSLPHRLEVHERTGRITVARKTT